VPLIEIEQLNTQVNALIANGLASLGDVSNLKLSTSQVKQAEKQKTLLEHKFLKALDGAAPDVLNNIEDNPAALEGKQVAENALKAELKMRLTPTPKPKFAPMPSQPTPKPKHN
jgi:hypothetical protein